MDYVNTYVGTLAPRQRRVHGLVWVYTALLALIALLIQFTGDRWWSGTLLMFGPRWVWGVPLFPLALIAVVPLSAGKLRATLPPLPTRA